VDTERRDLLEILEDRHEMLAEWIASDAVAPGGRRHAPVESPNTAVTRYAA